MNGIFEETLHLRDIIGVIVEHRGRTMTLQPSCGQWEASTEVQPEDVEPHDVVGFGATPDAALDACADEADLVESDDEEPGEEDENLDEEE